VRVSRKGLAMNALGTKLLAVSLAGILALPLGYCREEAVASPTAPASHCCERSDQHSQIPATGTKSCCCQERLTATQATKVRKRAVIEFPSFLPLAERDAAAPTDRTALLSTAALRPPNKHSLQATLCVWRL
jgi:hypothetical protein